MNPSSSIYSENQRSTVIDPYYVKGDVFQRDSRYYDQVISSRRNRTPNKSGFPLDASQLSNNIRSNTGVNPNTVLSGPITTSSGNVIQSTSNVNYINQPGDSVIVPGQTQGLSNSAPFPTTTTVNQPSIVVNTPVVSQPINQPPVINNQD